MVESLSELNKLCQKPDYKTKGNWYVRTILRDAALPVTRLLLHTPITANQVTLISLAVALFGMFILMFPGPAAFFLGAFLLQLWYYLDHVDGQIARYRKTASLTGRFLDFLTHHIVHPALFFALGFYCSVVSELGIFALWGFLSALAIFVFNVMHDVKYKTFFEKLEQEGGTIQPKVKSAPASGKEPASFLRRVFSFMHKLCEIHVMMNILTFAAVLQLFWQAVDLRFFLFIVYGILSPSILVLKLAYILKTKKIDQEYSEIFNASV